MNGDRHQRRPVGPFADELLEPERQGVEEVTRTPEARVHQVAAVVVRLRVRDDEERPFEAARVGRNVVGRAV
jgi:hypothetical protein